MSSIFVPCPECSLLSPRCCSQQRQQLQKAVIPVSASSRTGHLFASGSARFLPLQLPSQNQHGTLRAQASKVVVESSMNSIPKVSEKIEAELSDGKVPELANRATPVATINSNITAFLAEVSNIVNLVHSKDIVELQLKKMDCELVIRKKEALPQPLASAPVVMMQAPPQAMLPQPPLPQAYPPAAASPSTPSSPAALPSPAKASISSLPALKCPMAGTFYRCPAPGEPPFVKVGDKVQKGQVVCIIEAMKLMNEIEADQSGTVVDVLAEDGKPVSIDSPLLIIQP